MINILIAGDFCPTHRVEKLIDSGNYDCLSEAKPYLSKMDYSIVNLEAPIVLKDTNPIIKTGPNLKCSIKSIEAIKSVGFNAVTLANNHFYDYGDVGVYDTLDACKSEEIDYMGGGKDIQEATRIFYKSIKNKIIAFINVCESEWSIASKSKGGSAPLQVIKNYYQIQEAKKKSDYVIVIVHGGTELYELPTPRMKETYRFFIDAGANAVINHHQHCFSGYEVYRSKLIFYGLGNFCFDSSQEENKLWYEGFMVNLQLGDSIEFELIPYTQCKVHPKVEIMKDKTFFDKKILALNDIINDDSLLESKFQELISQKEKTYNLFLEPVRNKYFLALRSRGFFPSLSQKGHKKLLLNLIRCESHKDILENILEKTEKINN